MNSDHDIMFQTPVEDLPYLDAQVGRMCSSLFVDIGDHCCIVSRNHDTREMYVFYGFLQCETNGHHFQNIDMELGFVFQPATMKG